jgi:hypothetical protein
MARIGVSITKSTAFRNSTQEFSNVYYYEVDSTPTVAQADTFIDNLTALEKTFHASNVTFVRGRCWSAGGGAAANNMISQKQLSGTGARSAVSSSLDKERAWLFRIRAGVSSNGQPVYLRKWFHCCGEFVAAQGIPTAVMENTTSFTTAQRNAQVAAMNGIGNANGSPLLPALVAKSGRGISGGATWEAHPFLEHHQFGDQWRAL